eukprot:5693493-Pleurochrysis_carterae.AAC.2
MNSGSINVLRTAALRTATTRACTIAFDLIVAHMLTAAMSYCCNRAVHNAPGSALLARRRCLD